MNDSIQDTQNTGKSFENIATADILGADPVENTLNNMNTNKNDSIIITTNNESNENRTSLGSHNIITSNINSSNQNSNSIHNSQIMGI